VTCHLGWHNDQKEFILGAWVKRTGVLVLLIAASTALTPAAQAVGGGPYVGDYADSANAKVSGSDGARGTTRKILG